MTVIWSWHIQTVSKMETFSVTRNYYPPKLSLQLLMFLIMSYFESSLCLLPEKYLRKNAFG